MKSVFSTNISSGSILERIRSLDKLAWDQFVDIYAPLIRHWCLQSGMNEADAAEMTQEVFAQVVKAIANFRPSPNGTLRGWLWTITRNRIRDFFRQQPSRVAISGGTDLQVQLAQYKDPIDVFDDETQNDPTTETESAKLMSRAIKQIESDVEERTWRAFWKAVIDGEKTADIAEELGMTSNNVRQAKSRVLRRIRQQLGEV